MLQQVLALLIILVTYLGYAYWFKPVRTIKSYVKNLRERGYKVLEVPYNPLQNDMIATIRKGRKYGDDLKVYKEQRRDYDVIVSNTLTRPRLQFHHPDFIRDFYSIEKLYDVVKTEAVIEVYARIAGHGLIFSEGEVWKRKRTILNKIFNFEFIKSLSGKISQICEQTMKQFDHQQGKRNLQENSVTYSLVDLTVRIFSRVMMESFLGGARNQVIQGLPAGQYLRRLLTEISTYSFTPVNFLLGPKFTGSGLTKRQRDINHQIRVFNEWGQKFIKKRMAEINEKLKNQQSSPQKQYNDLLEAIVRAQHSSQNPEEMISSEKEVFEEFTTFYIAGTDTTSNYTQMLIYQLARHPEVQKKLRRQIDTHMKDDDYSYQNIKKFVYLDLIQKELTRTYGPFNQLFSRYAKCDTALNGLQVKKGTGVAIFLVCNNFNQKYFDNPTQFIPERWQTQKCKNLPAFVTGGFSAGPRTCIGKHLALLESKIAVIKFLKRYTKIVLPNPNFKMEMKFMYAAEDFQTKMILNKSMK